MNKTICLVVDSSGNLSRDFLKQHNISEVSFYFKFKNTDYFKENIDYETSDFFKHMEKDPDDIPKTSAPNPHDWLSSFEEQYAKGARKYIVTTISSTLSSSFQTATIAKQIFEDKYDDIQIEVIDSNTCAGGQAALEIWIAKMILGDKKYNYIIDAIYKLLPDLNTIFVVDSLKYMNAGGRIGEAAMFLGKVINIKPISELVKGEVKVIKPMIGRKKSLRKMVDVAISRIENIYNTIIVIQNAGFQQDAEYLYDYIKETTNNKAEIFKSNLGITVGAHTGPGTMGIGFLEFSNLD